VTAERSANASTVLQPHAHQHGSNAGAHARGLALVLGLTAAFVVVELFGSLISGSLALLADAGHTLTDVLGMSMALGAIWIARRPATSSRTFGLYRAEILAALFNSLLPFGIAALILFEAWQRFRTPYHVQSLPMLAVALSGMAVNLSGVLILQHGAKESLNIRGAFLETVADLLGAGAVLLAAVVILLTGWRPIDPIVSAGIALFILPRAWTLFSSVLQVLLEGTPRDVDLGQVEQTLEQVPGVVEVHELHVWTITSGFVAMSAHIEAEDRPSSDVLHDLQAVLHEHFGIEHATLQIERADHIEDGVCCSADPRCLASAEHQHAPVILPGRPRRRR
jgi:cobalt-zinc-cadmium efflux system protein